MDDFNLRKIWGLIWKKKILVVIFVVIGGVVGYVYNTKFTKPVYKSSSSIVLSVTQDVDKVFLDDVLDKNRTVSPDEIFLNQRLMNTYIQIIKSDSVLNKVIDNLGLDITSKQLVNSIQVYSEPKSTVIRISVTSTSPEQAASIVNELEKVFFERIDELYNIKTARVLDEPSVDKNPFNINPKKYTFFGVLIGLIAAMTVIVLNEVLNENIKSESKVEDKLKLNVLSNIQHINSKSMLISLKKDSNIAEGFKALSANIKGSKCKSVLIVSNLPEAGKSFVSANLAVTYANSGKKTLLIDSDMRKGTQHLLFGITNTAGLSDLVLDDEVDYKKYLQEDVVHNLDILTKGSANLNYSKLLSSEAIEKILKDARKEYDFIIVDGTPSQMVVDGALICKLVDSTIIVAKYNHTKYSDISKLSKEIKRNGGNILGLVINDVPKSLGKYSSYYGND